MQEDIIGQRIYEIRTSKRMTQLSLGMKLGVSQETISAYENNKTFPTLSNIIKMCEIFSVSSDYLLGITEAKSWIMYNDLESSEQYLVRNYRQLSIKGKMMIDNQISMLLKHTKKMENCER